MISFWVFNRLQATIFAIAALWGFSSLLGYSVTPVDWIIVPLLATCVYQLNRLSDFEEDRVNYPEDAKDAKSNQKIIVAVVFGILCVILAFGFLYGSFTGFIIIVGLLVLGYLYSIPAIGKAPKLRIKDTFIGKNLAPAVGTATAVCLYPAINAGRNLDFEVLSCFAAVLVGSFLLEMICDVRDYAGDRKANIQSIPVRLGLSHTKLIINALNTVSGMVILVAVFFEILPLPWIVFFANSILIGIITNVLFGKLSSHRLISHALIFFQILLACVLGLVS